MGGKSSKGKKKDSTYDDTPKKDSTNSGRADRKKGHEQKFSRIADGYKTLDEVIAAFTEYGLESSNLIIGIDFTKSNEMTGKRSFDGKNLHHIGEQMNPYEQAISIIGRPLSSFHEDKLIKCFGFGDVSTHDQSVFSFYRNGRSCKGFDEVLSRYREMIPHLKLAGPTSFAPIIEEATSIVQQSGGEYHILLIFADGQVTRSVNTEPGHFSPQERRTVDAIVRASEYPLSIVIVGVGDGPWDLMKEFDDHVPTRTFNNFKFVNFTEIMSKNTNQMKKDMEFAHAVLMDVPLQYIKTLELGILGQWTSRFTRNTLPTPVGIDGRSSSFDDNQIFYKSRAIDLISFNHVVKVDFSIVRSKPLPFHSSLWTNVPSPKAQTFYRNVNHFSDDVLPVSMLRIYLPRDWTYKSLVYMVLHISMSRLIISMVQFLLHSEISVKHHPVNPCTLPEEQFLQCKIDVNFMALLQS